MPVDRLQLRRGDLRVQVRGRTSLAQHGLGERGAAGQPVGCPGRRGGTPPPPRRWRPAGRGPRQPAARSVSLRRVHARPPRALLCTEGRRRRRRRCPGTRGRLVFSRLLTVRPRRRTSRGRARLAQGSAYQAKPRPGSSTPVGPQLGRPVAGQHGDEGAEAGHRVGVHRLRRAAEVGQADERPAAGVPAPPGQHGVVADVQDRALPAAAQGRQRPADLPQPLQPAEHPALERRRVVRAARPPPSPSAGGASTGCPAPARGRRGSRCRCGGPARRPCTAAGCRRTSRRPSTAAPAGGSRPRAPRRPPGPARPRCRTARRCCRRCARPRWPRSPGTAHRGRTTPGSAPE